MRNGDAGPSPPRGPDWRAYSSAILLVMESIRGLLLQLARVAPAFLVFVELSIGRGREFFERIRPVLVEIGDTRTRLQIEPGSTRGVTGIQHRFQGLQSFFNLAGLLFVS